APACHDANRTIALNLILIEQLTHFFYVVFARLTHDLDTTKTKIVQPLERDFQRFRAHPVVHPYLHRKFLLMKQYLSATLAKSASQSEKASAVYNFMRARCTATSLSSA